MLKKNDIIRLEITDITNECNGVGRFEGLAVFVPFCAPGDIIDARVVKVLPRYAFGAIVSVISPSDGRAAPDCAAYGRCGSCGLRHIAYERELLIKNGWVQENFRRIGGFDVTLPPALPSPLTDRYRNKAIYPVKSENGVISIGFFAKRSHRITPVDDCLLHPEMFADICAAFKGWLLKYNISVYDENAHSGLVRSLFLRHAEATGEVMATVISNGEALPHENELAEAVIRAYSGTVSVMLNVNTDKTNVLLGKRCRVIWGRGSITDRLCGLDFSLSPLSFYQVNRQGAEQLYRTAAEFAALKGGETLLDLYCGTGTIGLSMAKKVKQLIGVEIIPEAIENARENALQNGIENARFICNDADEAAKTLEKEGLSPDVIVLDPPRKGLANELIATVCRMAPDRVVMVSCDSATAARDAAIFARHGYSPKRIQAVDMFPRTGHIESVTLLSR